MPVRRYVLLRNHLLLSDQGLGSHLFRSSAVSDSRVPIREDVREAPSHAGLQATRRGGVGLGLQGLLLPTCVSLLTFRPRAQRVAVCIIVRGRPKRVLENLRPRNLDTGARW